MNFITEISLKCNSDVKGGQNLQAEARATRPRPKIIMEKVPNNDQQRMI